MGTQKKPLTFHLSIMMNLLFDKQNYYRYPKCHQKSQYLKAFTKNDQLVSISDNDKSKKHSKQHQPKPRNLSNKSSPLIK